MSEPAAEEAIYDSWAMRQFAKIDLSNEPAPDETTICKFRHLMERHHLGDQFFHLVNEYLQENSMKVRRGTIVDATIINAPSSTRNKKKERDPDMRQTRKGNQWYFGMKAKDFTQKKGSRHRKLTNQERAANRHKSKTEPELSTCLAS